MYTCIKDHQAFLHLIRVYFIPPLCKLLYLHGYRYTIGVYTFYEPAAVDSSIPRLFSLWIPYTFLPTSLYYGVLIINPRRACARGLVLGLSFRPSFLPSVCLLLSVFHVFCDYAQRDNKTAIPTGSSPHWLHFKKGDFRITAAFESYGVKSKSRSQYAN